MNNIFIDIGKNSTTFSYADQTQLILPIGYENLSKQHFSGELPTPYETEAAIITIEDAIEQIYPKWRSTNKLVTNNIQILKIMHYFNRDKAIDSNQVELLFNRVADIIAGSPKREHELPDSIEFIASLLILREVLHHLGIKEITIV